MCRGRRPHPKRLPQEDGQGLEPQGRVSVRRSRPPCAQGTEAPRGQHAQSPRPRAGPSCAPAGLGSRTLRRTLGRIPSLRVTLSRSAPLAGSEAALWTLLLCCVQSFLWSDSGWGGPTCSKATSGALPQGVLSREEGGAAQGEVVAPGNSKHLPALLARGLAKGLEGRGGPSGACAPRPPLRAPRTLTSPSLAWARMACWRISSLDSTGRKVTWTRHFWGERVEGRAGPEGTLPVPAPTARLAPAAPSSLAPLQGPACDPPWDFSAARPFREGPPDHSLLEGRVGCQA